MQMEVTVKIQPGLAIGMLVSSAALTALVGAQATASSSQGQGPAGRVPSDSDRNVAAHEEMLPSAWSDILHHATDQAHRYFRPNASSSFALVPNMTKKVNVTFLDNTMFKGYDGSDFVQIGQYRILTRLCFITETEGQSLHNVDGIIGFEGGSLFTESRSMPRANADGLGLSGVT